MEYRALTLGSMATNCYLAWCPESMEALVIDPGFEPDTVLKEIADLGLKVRYIVNTHGHIDHIGANRALHEALGAPIAIGREDGPMLADPRQNLSGFIGGALTSPAPQLLLDEGDSLEFGGSALQVLATPGHTPGGISLYGHGRLFCGDTLFCESIGRSDFPGGDHRLLLKSIREKLLPLPGETQVLPGHGPASTLAYEKANNPWLRG
jgi:glyoxylase-like metal-dependent hydrolase (beta-lactamase superfamily II)